MKEIKYKGEEIRLTKYLCEEANVNYNLVRRLLRQKDIKINGVKVKEDVLIKNGDILQLYYEEVAKPIVVFEDENVLVIDKKKGIPSVGDSSLETTLQTLYGEDISAVHRLDTNTDGLIIFAKNFPAKAELENAFFNRQIVKKYACLVCGVVSKPHDIMEHYLYKSEDEVLVKVSDTPQSGWLKAITEYTVIGQKGDKTLLDITLHTGRTHQIRAVFAFIQCPVAGDGKYGKTEKGLQKQQLTAYKMAFDFPKNSKLAYLNAKTFEIDYKTRIRF